VTYREAFEQCPRCKVVLEDARSARGCRACGGLWLDESVLTEMIMAMRPMRPLDRVELAVIHRDGPALGCPTCSQPMLPSAVHDIPIDRCPKHGVWFDALELETALRRVAERGSGPTSEQGSAQAGERVPDEMPHSKPVLVCAIDTPGQVSRTLRLADEVIKIGRAASAQLRIEDDSITRMHAVIEVGELDVRVIDLGSSLGTLVNGERVNAAVLRSGDEIRIGATTIGVTFES
jgi:Zn-finger nucleic acid-binding protein